METKMQDPKNSQEIGLTARLNEPAVCSLPSSTEARPTSC